MTKVLLKESLEEIPLCKQTETMLNKFTTKVS